MLKRICLLAFVVLALSNLIVKVTAQVSGQPYRLSDREVQRLLDRIKNKTSGFRDSLKKALNKSRIDGSAREDNINTYVKSFEEETKRLDDHFKHHKSTAVDVQSVLQHADRINTFMARHDFDQVTQASWDTLRSDVGQLADVYNVNWQWGQEWRTPPYVNSPIRVDDRQVEQIIHNIESSSDKFRKSLDAALDRSRFDGTRREDDINAFVKEFYRETKVLHDHFDDHKATSSDVQTVLDRAAQIESFLRRNRLRNDRDAHRDWLVLRGYLDELARAYSVTWRW
jgi:hypothetical protein